MDDYEKEVFGRLKNDFIHYAKKCLKIRTKSGDIEPFLLNKAQLHIHTQLQNQLENTGKVRALVLKGRQQGCSTLIGARFFHRVTHSFGTQAFILTHALEATSNLYVMAKRYYEHTPDLVKPTVSKTNAKELVFGKLDSGYRLGTAENKNVGRSATIQLLHGCLSGDSLIVLPDGSTKSMLDIEIGDLVMTSTGAAAKVKNKIYTGKKQTYKFSCWNSGEPIYLTKDHKVLTLDGYKPLEQLTVNDFIAMPKIEPKGITEISFKLSNNERPQGGGSKHIENYTFTLDKDFGYFIGYYLAEGHIKEGNGYITFTYHKDEKYITNALKSIKNIATSIRHQIEEGSNRKRTHINGKFLACAINYFCGRVSNKNIPAWFFDTNVDFLDGVLRGYLDGDGSKTSNDKITAPSIHEKIARQIQRICWLLHGACSINRFKRNRYGKPTKDIYLLRLCGNTLKKYQGRSLSLRKEKSIVLNGIVYCKVKSIEERFIENVWDIEVDHPDHNFQTTTGIVSNSEVAFWNNAAEHSTGIMQAVPNAPGTEIILESTACGVGNYFHQQWQQAERGISDFIPIFVPWYWQDEYIEPIPKDWHITTEEQELVDQYNLSPEQLYWRRKKIIQLSVNGVDGEKAFKQEYPNNANEAFILTGEDSYVDSGLVVNARHSTVEPYGPLLVGVDPARFGDDRTSIIYRKGRAAFDLKSYVKKDTMEVAGIVHTIITEKNPAKVFVDVGGLGAGVVDRLNELGHSEVVVAVNAGASPLEASKYKNKRAEMWGQMREWLSEPPVQIPDSDSLHSDLCGIKYKFDSNSRLVMESKEDMKKRGIRSSDEADALALTFSLPPSALEASVNKKQEQVMDSLVNSFEHRARVISKSRR